MGGKLSVCRVPVEGSEIVVCFICERFVTNFVIIWLDHLFGADETDFFRHIIVQQIYVIIIVSLFYFFLSVIELEDFKYENKKNREKIVT